jgi:hypothetical protein
MRSPLIGLTAPFSPSFETFARLIRLDACPEAEDEARRLFAAAAEALVPRSICRISYIEERAERGDCTAVTADSVSFCAKVLRELNGVHRIFPYIITCGNEMEQYDLKQLDMLAPFWLDTVKTMALGAARLHTVQYLKETYGIGTLNSVNPGSGNVDIWPVEQLSGIFSLLGGGNPAGVRLTESSLMVPNKTIAGLFFESEKSFTSCSLCEREHCPGRKEEFAGVRL